MSPDGLPEDLRTCWECVFDRAVRWFPVREAMSGEVRLEGYCPKHGPPVPEGDWLSREEALIWLTMEE